MADDVDPNESPNGESNGEGQKAVDALGAGDAGEQPATGDYGPVDIAVVEIELVEFDAAESDPGADGPSEPAVAEDDHDEPLPTMADLDRVASELDAFDARLAALDEQRP